MDKCLRFKVNGMHCTACETLIENYIAENEKAVKVKADLNAKTVEIVTSNPANFTEGKLDSKFKDLGYTFEKLSTDDKVTNTNINPTAEMILGLLIGAFIAYADYLFERSGKIGLLNLNPNSSFLAYFMFGFAASVSSCAALVGGILISASKHWPESKVPFVLFNTGRLTAFAIFGFVLGLLGNFLQISSEISSILTIVVALIMIVTGLQMLGIQIPFFKQPKLFQNLIIGNSKNNLAPFTIGALTFFLPCGFTLIAQTNAINMGNPITSTIALTSFALGTLPMLVLVSYSSIKLYKSTKASRIFGYIVSSLIIFFGVSTLIGQFNTMENGFLLGNNNVVETKSLEIKPSNFSEQYLQLEATGFSYSPRTSRIKVNVPTVLQIYNNGAHGCAQAVIGRGLFPETLYLQPGMNELRFTPKRVGAYKINCPMGMVPPVTVYVE